MIIEDIRKQISPLVEEVKNKYIDNMKSSDLLTAFNRILGVNFSYNKFELIDPNGLLGTEIFKDNFPQEKAKVLAELIKKEWTNTFESRRTKIKNEVIRQLTNQVEIELVKQIVADLKYQYRIALIEHIEESDDWKELKVDLMLNDYKIGRD